MAKMGYNLKIVGDDYQRQEPYATKLERLGVEIVAADGALRTYFTKLAHNYTS